MSYTDRITEALGRLSTYRLANMADANYEDLDSPGARFLRSVRDDVIESLRFAEAEGPEDVRRWSEGDAPGEISDDNSQLTYAERWAVAGDLQVWMEDVSEFGPQADVMESVGLALYLISDRLVSALVEFVCELGEESECECLPAQPIDGRHGHACPLYSE